jgi:hypothetical protein
MPYVKPSVHLSRLAGTALKSFTHGYAQTVVGFAAQNTTPSHLADTLAGRARKAERSKLQNVFQNVDGSRAASTASVPRPETSHRDSGLEQCLDAWQKQQRSGGTWQQFPFAKRIEWQPPSTVPTRAQEAPAAGAEDDVAVAQKDEELSAPSLKRSYTTSALDNFGALEASALEQVNNAIAEEIQKIKEDVDEALTLKAPSSVATSLDASLSDEPASSTPATVLTPTGSFSSASEVEVYVNELSQLVETRQYDRIPAAFQAMLRAGVQKPSPAAYRALLTSAIELTQGKHHKVPKALEVYSDMLRRKVTPDSETFATLISLLAKRSSEVVTLKKALEERLVRYGGLEQPGKFMFRSSESELGYSSMPPKPVFRLCRVTLAQPSSLLAPSKVVWRIWLASTSTWS